MNEEMSNRARQLDMRLYTAKAEEDLLIMQWWLDMIENGDLLRMLPRSSHTLSAFFNLFRPPAILLYSPHENSLDFAAWFNMLETNAAIMSMWVAKRLRHTKRGAALARYTYDMAFTQVETIFGFTKRPAILRLHQRIGYEILARIPHFFDRTDDAWAVMLTKDEYMKGGLYESLQ